MDGCKFKKHCNGGLTCHNCNIAAVTCVVVGNLKPCRTQSYEFLKLLSHYLDRISKRNGFWKASSLSFADRITLT